MNDVDVIMQGSIDMHIHPGPDTFPSGVDAVEVAGQAQRAGMKAIVIKNHCYPTAALATVACRLVPDVKVFGGICLNAEVGGLNYDAVEASAVLGAKLLWMPTLSADNSRSKMRAVHGIKLSGDGFSILDGNGNLRPEVGPILSLVKKYDMVLASGHISPVETFALIEEALKIGINKLVITHPNSIEVMDQVLDLQQQQKLASKGAFIEYVGMNLLPTTFKHDPLAMAESIKAIGARHFIMSTDMGPAPGPSPVEGMRIFVSALLHCGITKEEIELMVKTNPAQLLGLA